jgi:asparagine synthase (glutamine-hydrolysing)
VYGEPFADPSAIPTMLIAAAAREHVTVVLTGDGGDELFAGYNRQVFGDRIDSLGRRLPSSLVRPIGRTMLATPPAPVDSTASSLAWLARRSPPRSPGEKLHKVARHLDASRREPAVAADLASRIWMDPAALTGRGADVRAEGASFGEALLSHDRGCTLPEQMLAKVDRATMRVALEARPPLLDPRVVAQARSTPLDILVRGGKGKAPLRDVVSRLIDPALLDRPKMGFDPPIGEWLRGPLREWATERLAPSELRASGISGTEVVREAWDRHQAGRSNEDYRLWSVLQYQAWVEWVRRS